jgi:hypothetical protein
MATPYSEIFDLAKMLFKDYRLENLFTLSEEDFTTYLSGWLPFAVTDFKKCNQSLVRDETLQQFNETLTEENKVILSELVFQYWLTKEVNDVKQMNLHITDRDLKLYSESQNLREKSNHLDKVKEELSQKLLSYGYDHLDWTKWYSGNFGG